MIAGATTAAETLSLTAERVTLLPALLRTTTRYCVPFRLAAGEESVYVAPVAPAMSAKVMPALVLSCHW